jgi:hypothetical protein
MQTTRKVLDHYMMLFRAFIEKLPWAFATAGLFEGMQYWLGVDELLNHRMMFVAILAAILLDTVFGVRVARTKEEKVTFGIAFSGIMRKITEYWATLFVTILATSATDGATFWGAVMEFVLNGIFVGIIFAEVSSAMKHADVRLRMVFSAVIDQTVKRFVKDEEDRNRGRQ